MSTPGCTEMDQVEKDAQTDIRLLVECVKCQLDNPDALKKSLVALATLFSIHENGKDFFRKAGGIKFLVELLTTSKHREVKGAVLYVMACAVEKNVFSQRDMSSDSTFTYLKDLVAAPYSEMKLIKSALYLIMCLVANNSHGQVMVRQSGCLQGLLHLFRKSMPSTEDYTFSSSVSESSPFKNKNDEHYKDLWTSVTSALCICVNNPQNEENQRCCATIFPYIFKRLKNISDLKVMRPILSLVSLAVGNNVHNQERVVCSDGIHSLMSCLFKVADKAKNNPTYLALAGQIAGALGSCIADNALNAKLVGKQGGVKIFLQLLDIKPIDIETKEHIIVTLGYCVDACEENKKLFAEENGFAVLAQHLVNEEQEDFNKAVKFVLKTCVSAGQKKLNATSDKASDLFSALIKPCIQFDDLDGDAEQRKMIPCSGRLEIEVEKLAQNQKLLEQKLEAVSCVQANETAVEKQLPPFAPNKEIAVMETEDKRLLKESGAGYYSKNLLIREERKDEMEKNEENFGCNVPLDKTEVSLQKFIRQPTLEQEKSTDTPENCSVHKKELTKCNGEEEAKRCHLTDHTGTCISAVDRASSLPVICSNIERMPVVEINQGVEFAKPKIVVNKKKSTTKFARPTAVVKEKELVSSASSTLCHTVKRALLPTNAIRDFPSDPFRKTYGCYTGPVRLVEANNLGLGMELAESSEPSRFPPQTVQEDVCVTPVKQRWTHKENIRSRQNYTVADREDINVTPVKQRKMQRNVNSNEADTTCMSKREGISITPVQQRWSYNRDCCFTAPKESKRHLNFQDSIIESSNLHGEKVEDYASEFDCNLVKQAEKPNHDPSKLQESVPKITSLLIRPVKCYHTTDTCFVAYHDEDSNHSAPEQNEKYHWKNTADKSCSKCPGCQTPEVIGCPVLNSRTFNIALETSQYACVKHRLLRNVERHHLSMAKKKQTWKKLPRQPLSEFSEPGNKSIHVYDFLSSETEDDLGKKVTPPSSPISFNLKLKSTIPRRRQRKPYTDKELSYLTEGVCKLGTRWNQILCTYPFHQCRTSVDLKEKYYRLKKEKNMGSNQGLALHSFKPFSLCELRRLKRGVRQHGYNWKVILRSFKFDKERTPADLRTKWKTICNVSLL